MGEVKKKIGAGISVRRTLKTDNKFEDRISYEISSVNGTPVIGRGD
jgi:hypothetical protein